MAGLIKDSNKVYTHVDFIQESNGALLDSYDIEIGDYDNTYTE